MPGKVKKRLLLGVKILVGLILTILIVLIALIVPQLFVVTGYVAKETCSCTFIAGRSESSIRKEDTGVLVGKYANVEIDEANKLVKVSLWGMHNKIAVYREGLGCALVKKSEVDRISNQKLTLSSPQVGQDSLPWPLGDELSTPVSRGISSKSLDVLLDSAIQVAGTRALLIVHNNQLLGERYAPGFDKDTRQLGWSMNKSITQAIIGILIKQGKLKLHQPAPVEEWANDERKDITLHNLLQMSSGLKWNEFYFGESQITQMLFGDEMDIGTFAINQPAIAPPDSIWSYSSGTTNILSEIIERQFSTQEEAQVFPYQALFHKIGMYSMRLEADPSGTYVGSSFAWATPRDWARFGLLYLNDGVWNGERILPEGWVDYTRLPAEKSDGKYGAHFWLNFNGHPYPSVPKDTYFADGFNGQRIIIIPSENLIIVKMGLNPFMGPGLDMNKFIVEVMKALEGGIG